MPSWEALIVGLDGARRPRELRWRQRRYRVTDEPTRLDPYHPALTHPLPVPDGWRFQATSDDGDARVFDIRYDPAAGGWLLLHTYV